MKKIVILLLCVFSTLLAFSQSNKDIAKIYIKRANTAIETAVDYKGALVSFEKAMEKTDSITDRSVAGLGAKIYFELGQIKKSNEYISQYFILNKNKSTEEYVGYMEFFVMIQEALEEKEAEEKRLEEERLRKERELKRIDSLKTAWTTKSDALSLKLDSIYAFNKNKLALYKNEGSFGIIKDNGEVFKEANSYKHGFNFDGYFVLLNKKENPTKIYTYNSETKSEFVLPDVAEFNPLSTNYGKVTYARGNGRIVAYPNETKEALVYDIEERKFVKISDIKSFLKKLRKADIIDKYKDQSVRLNSDKWYFFGGHLGGGIHPLFNEDNTLYGYLNSATGKEISASDVGHLGTLYNSKIQSKRRNKVYWVDKNGEKVKAPENEAGEYKGSSIVKRLENGNYQFLQKGIIILGDKKLEKLADFLRNNKK
ncbi:hypothetical protein OD91_1323 [Lutibacter sp. Hel_I_33_5]|uniref:hypothetical protein n=1 Tax=Lutibacter sp. Hel_I_33_5 TaxID=1566289 RepID=UPI0011A002B9|nr:hypothetical protein [Lutibacter sp. Hel_I_33_5]TVZ56044.1 hypothetical protein OD91_1323 [Lutibacter sp. Hel_I_33_5]